MSLLSDWRSYAYETEKSPKENQVFWANYFAIEQGIYEKLLADPDTVVKGTVKELAEKYGCKLQIMVGFLDGINDSLKTPNPIEDMTEDTEVSLDFDKEKLYYNMVGAKADWLYNLPAWRSKRIPAPYVRRKRSSPTIPAPAEAARNTSIAAEESNSKVKSGYKKGACHHSVVTGIFYCTVSAFILLYRLTTLAFSEESDAAAVSASNALSISIIISSTLRKFSSLFFSSQHSVPCQEAFCLNITLTLNVAFFPLALDITGQSLVGSEMSLFSSVDFFSVTAARFPNPRHLMVACGYSPSSNILSIVFTRVITLLKVSGSLCKELKILPFISPALYLSIQIPMELRS